MHIEYNQSEIHRISFDVFEAADFKVHMGQAEGYLGINHDLISVVKVFEGFEKRGYGEFFFKKIFDHFTSFTTVASIVGSWHRDEEFAYVEGGQSTNLTVFQNLIAEGFSNNEAALNTPTGKWASKLGYTNITFKQISAHEVSVRFSKP